MSRQFGFREVRRVVLRSHDFQIIEEAAATDWVFIAGKFKGAGNSAIEPYAGGLSLLLR